MTDQEPQSDIVQGLDAFSSPSQCLNEIVQAWTEYLSIAEEEEMKRREIADWEKVNLAEIQAKRDFLMGYLERSFDKRAQSFKAIFRVIDRAIESGNNSQLALALSTMVEISESSPFKDIADLSTVGSAIDDPDRVWEF